MTFHSEQGQDRWLVQHVFGDRRNGVFVEAGAIDGLLFSNTLHFAREKGWAGILIEANPELLGPLSVNRPESRAVGCALASKLGVEWFEIAEGAPIGWAGLSGGADCPRNRLPPSMRRRTMVQTRTLAAVLLECGIERVDYLSLDIEGHELDVLSAFPFQRFDIDVIGVEDNSGANVELRQLLIDNGYQHLARVGVDEIWQRAQ